MATIAEITGYLNELYPQDTAEAWDAVGLTVGAVLLLLAVNKWRVAEFGELDYSSTMRLVVPGVTLTALGFQTLLTSFFISVLAMRRK